MRQIIKTGLTFLFIFIQVFVFAQTKNAPNATLESPFNTMWVHLYYLQNDTYAPGISAQTIPNIPDSTRAIRRAIQIKQILDGKGLYVHLENIPQDSGYIDSTTNKPYFTPFPTELPEIYLERINGRWFYSTETVRLTPALHKEIYPFGSDVLLNLLPHELGQKKLFGIAIWQYLGALIMLFLAGILDWILSRMIRPIVRRLSRSKLYPELVPKKLIAKIARKASVFLALQVLKIFLPALLLSPETTEGLTRGIKIIETIVIMLLLLRILDVVMLYLKNFAEKTTSKMDEQLIPILKKMGQVVLVGIAVIRILSLLDVNVTALIAGVSIGGLALALAAQDTVKNLIGSAMIFMDRPFQIGDWIDGGGVSGTVVEVGFRTTRLKQADSSIIAVPNGTIANAAVTNLGVRAYRLFQMTLGMTYGTPPELLEKFIEGLKGIILNHPNTQKENFYVHLSGLGASSVDIYFRTSLEVSEFKDELKAKEEILFAIIRLADTLGVHFAFPSSSVYVENFPGKIGNSPTYEKDPKVLEDKLKAFLEDFKSKSDS